MALTQVALELRFNCRYRLACSQDFTFEHAGERLEFGATEIVTKIGDFPVHWLRSSRGAKMPFATTRHSIDATITDAFPATAGPRILCAIIRHPAAEDPAPRTFGANTG